LNLTDLCPIEKWMELEQQITRLSGLDANVFDTSGYRITGYKHWANRLCPAIKNTDKGQSFICAVAHMNIATMARETGKTVIEECDAGLVKMVVPIVYNEEFIGAVGACGMLPDAGEVDDFLVNKVTGIAEETIRDLSSDLAFITSEKLQSLADVIEKAIASILAAHRQKSEKGVKRAE